MSIRKKSYFKVGFSFGLASGSITTLGLMIGLYSTTYSKAIVIGGILTIAIADAFSDSIGIHFAEEVKGINTTKEIWLSTITTFITKFAVACSFMPAILLLPLKIGIVFNIFWSLNNCCFWFWH